MRKTDRTDNISRSERMRIVGVGKAGVNIVHRVMELWPNTPHAVAVDTDAESLAKSRAPTRVQIGKELTRGLGSGGNPELGGKAGEEDAALLREIVSDTDIVFVIAGLGGGTGSGATPVLVRCAQEAGAMTLCLVTMPFRFEGAECMTRADVALNRLLEIADVAVVVQNDDCFDIEKGSTPLVEAFEEADETICAGSYAIWKMMSDEGAINLGFSDFRNVLRHGGDYYAMGYGWGVGVDRAGDAVKAAVNCSMLGKGALAKADALMVGIIGGASMTLNEINAMMSEVRTTARRTSGVFMGAVIDKGLGDRLLVSVMALQGKPAPKKPDDKPESVDAPLTAGARKKGQQQQASAIQPDLGLHSSQGSGRFKGMEPTNFAGENVDEPAYLRRGIHVVK